MIKNIIEEIYGKTPASFSIQYSPNEGAKILSKKSKRTGIFAKDSVIGKSNVSEVILHIARPLLTSNSFTPYFYGKFVIENGETKLVGYFTLHPFIKIFVTMWFVMTALFGVVFLIIGIGDKSLAGLVAGTIFMVLCFCFGFIGYVFVRMCKKLNSGNINKIKDHILETYRNIA